jgi:hypothetical protein
MDAVAIRSASATLHGAPSVPVHILDHLLPVLPLVNPSSAPFVWPAFIIAQVF